jgi:Zn-dependent protease/CBS domain-containing protein
MNESIHLGTIRGIRVGIHWSLLIIFWLVALGLAGSQLPHSAPGHTNASYWFAALAATVVFYLSLLAHEVAHAVVARRHHIEVEGIVLWLLGGTSKLNGEPADPGSEGRIAIAGPATSVVLAIVFWFFSRLLGTGHPASLVAAVFGWLGWLNGLLAAFNLLPAFPLDGGRVLRALLWHHDGDKRHATTTAARTGSVFGYGMIAVGIVGFFATRGGFNGLWLALIGWFLLSASRSEAAVSTTTEGLQGLRVRDVMTPNPMTVPAWVSLNQLMDEGVHKRRLSSFPVVDINGMFVGLVTLPRIRQVPAAQWPTTTTASVARPASLSVTCRPDDDLIPVATRMAASADHRAVVLDDTAHVVGIVSPGDLHRTPVTGATEADGSHGDADGGATETDPGAQVSL